jgi:dienelactone hydrolase
VEHAIESLVSIPSGDVHLTGDLIVPVGAPGIVVFAHGSGSSRLSPRNQAVAARLRRDGFGTLLMDLLTADEEYEERFTRHLRFDIPLLAGRLVDATRFVASHAATEELSVGYFGASTGAAAALVAAAELGDEIRAVVSRGGRPDLAGDALPLVTAPTLLIVGGADTVVLELNRQAMELMRTEVQLEVVPGATHLFSEPGALEQVADLAAAWFGKYLAG